MAFRARARRRIGRSLGLTHTLGSAFHKVFASQPDCVLLSQGDVLDILSYGDLRRDLERGVPFVTLNHLCIDGRILTPSSIETVGRIFSQAQCNAFVSNKNLRLAERQLARPIPNPIIVQNPVNLSNTAEVPWPADGPVRFASVARVDAWHKGQDVLFEVLSRSEWHDRDWVCRVYGTGPHEGYLKALARHYGISSRVIFAGHADDIRAIWADNHMLVMPSRQEGIPLAIVEAMLCGRPSVVTDVGDNAAWVLDGRTGFVAEAATTESFGMAMERAWGARAKWSEMGSIAHVQASARIDRAPGKGLLKILLGQGAKETSRERAFGGAHLVATQQVSP
jgi:glycosyltransferase involved in cell wall biosynthesis